jgi:hypothetical protein
MVTVTNYKKSQQESGKDFFSLELQGGIEPVLSKSTGRFYLTMRSCYVSTTFDEHTCMELIGKSLPGRVNKVPCEPYEYTMKDSGEVIMLEHRWEYSPEEAPVIPLPPNPMVIPNHMVVG